MNAKQAKRLRQHVREAAHEKGFSLITTYNRPLTDSYTLFRETPPQIDLQTKHGKYMQVRQGDTVKLGKCFRGLYQHAKKNLKASMGH